MQQLRLPILLTTVMLGACDRRDVEPPLIVAHRGASYLAPENTLAAFNLAWSLNADLIEVDVYLSADGIIVCHHDATTKKTAGIDERVGKLEIEFQHPRLFIDVVGNVQNLERYLIVIRC